MMHDWTEARNIISTALKELGISNPNDAASAILARLANKRMLTVFADEIEFKSDLQAPHQQALKEAVEVIHLADNSDYLTALWTIVSLLGGDVELLERDSSAAFQRYSIAKEDNDKT